MSFKVGGDEPALAPGSLILVTGANSYVGSHVIDKLLGYGYKVRGTVRDKARCAWVSDLFEKKYPAGAFELVEVPDLNAPGVVEEVFKGPDGIVHVANVALDSIFTSNYDPDPAKVITPVIEGNLRALRAAVDGGTAKRFVFTSSSAGIYSPDVRSKKPKVITPHDFNTELVVKAWAPPPYTHERAFAFYAATKTQCDLAMLKYIREQDSDMVLNIVNPDTIIGTILGPPSSSGALFRAIWEQKDITPFQMIADLNSGWTVDVQDVAWLHVGGLLDPKVSSEKLLAYSHLQTGRSIREKFMRLQKELGEPEGIKGELTNDYECIDTIDNSRSLEVLKRLGRDGWISQEQSLRDTVVN